MTKLEHQKSAWQLVQQTLATQPIESQALVHQSELYFERYICQPMTFSVAPLPAILLGTQFGGTKIVGEAVEPEFQADFFTGFSVIIPANCATNWHFAGVTDMALIFIPLTSTEPSHQAIVQYMQDITAPIPVTEPLLSMSIQHIAQDLFKQQPNHQFVNHLAMVALEQVKRELEQQQEINVKPSYQQLNRIQRLIGYIQNNLSQPLTIATLAAQVDISATHLRRIFLAATGSPIHQFIIHLRLKKAREFLISTEMPLIQISTALGFNSQSHFITVFKRVHSTTPARYRQRFST